MMNNKGFTLIEVVVSMAILGLAVTGVFQLFAGSIANLGRIDRFGLYEIAADRLIQSVLVLDTLPPSGQASGRFNEIDADWNVELEPWIPNRLEGQPAEAVMKVSVEVGWASTAGRRNIRLEALKPTVLSYQENLGAALQRIVDR